MKVLVLEKHFKLKLVIWVINSFLSFYGIFRVLNVVFFSQKSCC